MRNQLVLWGGADCIGCRRGARSGAVGAVHDYFIATALVEADEQASARHRNTELSLVTVSKH